MIDPMVVGENIKRLRKASGLNQAQVAMFLEVDQSMISKIEKGERKVSSSLIERLSRLFCCSISSIIDDDADESIQIAFRSSIMTNEDLKHFEIINKIVLNQFEMDKLLKEVPQDE